MLYAIGDVVHERLPPRLIRELRSERTPVPLESVEAQRKERAKLDVTKFEDFGGAWKPRDGQATVK